MIYGGFASYYKKIPKIGTKIVNFAINKIDNSIKFYSEKGIDLNKFQLNKNKKIITNSNQNTKPILNDNDKVRYI